MIVNEGSLGFGLLMGFGQREQFEDVTLGNSDENFPH